MASFNSKTWEVAVQGKGRWMHLLQLNKFGKWSLELFPNKESLEIIRDLQADGLKNVIKKDDDGYFVRFSRDPTKKIRNVMVNFPAPTVTDMEGNPIHGDRIGNGSDITVLLECYTHPTPSGGTSVAARMKGVKIENLIPFNPDSDYTTEEAPIVMSLSQVQAQKDKLF